MQDPSEHIDLEGDAAEALASGPNDEGLKRVSELAKKQLGLEREIEDLSLSLQKLNEDLKAVAQKELPEAMSEVGIAEFRLETGEKVSVKQFYSGKIDDENRESAFSYLRDNGHAALIKHELKIDLGKGQDKQATELKQKATELSLAFSDKEGVHPQTLAAFIKEQVEAGSGIPLETFKAFIGRKTTIKLK